MLVISVIMVLIVLNGILTTYLFFFWMHYLNYHKRSLLSPWWWMTFRFYMYPGHGMIILYFYNINILYLQVKNLVNFLRINTIIYKKNTLFQQVLEMNIYHRVFNTGNAHTACPALTAHPAVQNVSFLDCTNTDCSLAEHLGFWKLLSDPFQAHKY